MNARRFFFLAFLILVGGSLYQAYFLVKSGIGLWRLSHLAHVAGSAQFFWEVAMMFTLISIVLLGAMVYLATVFYRAHKRF